MAAITPVASNGAGGVDLQRGLFTGTIAVGDDLLTDGTAVNTRTNFVLEVRYFADVDDDDTWASGILGIQGVAVQIDEGRTVVDAFTANLETANGLIRFKATDTSDNAGKGWLWILIDPAVARQSGTPVR